MNDTLGSDPEGQPDESSSSPPIRQILVPDAGVGVKWFVPEPDSDTAARLLETRFELRSPSYFFTERVAMSEDTESLRERIIAQIRLAFGHVSREDGETLREAEVISISSRHARRSKDIGPGFVRPSDDRWLNRPAFNAVS